jgi:phosphatidylethanolamine-binding protein (PEBP) family uncharacterized protein
MRRVAIVLLTSFGCDFLRRNSGGPRPPERGPHKYRFTVFALGMPMTWRNLRSIIEGYVVVQAPLTGLRGHSN